MVAEESERATHWTPQLREWLNAAALVVGFDAAGVAPAGADPRHSERFAAWIDAGRAGEMAYLARRDEHGQLLRGSIDTAIPWARSVIVCALNYNSAAPRSIDLASSDQGWIARYAWSGDGKAPTDYHHELLSRLRQIEVNLTERASCQTRCYVDTGPIVERSAAVKAGLGWTGKNTCILNQKLGSWLLLGVVLTSLPVEGSLTLDAAPDRCGSCTRCLDACPTAALVAPREMDASLCISYLSIEKKGLIPEALRRPMGRQVFGCDICQDVCPWNRKAPAGNTAGMAARPELINPSLEWLAGLDNAAFRHAFKGSPLERTGKKRLHRNVAIAMGNSGDRKFLPRLRAWATGDDPILAETSRWALRELEGHHPTPSEDRITDPAP